MYFPKKSTQVLALTKVCNHYDLALGMETIVSGCTSLFYLPRVGLISDARDVPQWNVKTADQFVATQM